MTKQPRTTTGSSNAVSDGSNQNALPSPQNTTSTARPEPPAPQPAHSSLIVDGPTTTYGNSSGSGSGTQVSGNASQNLAGTKRKSESAHVESDGKRSSNGTAGP